MDHPNICTIYEIDETDEGQVYIAMTYYEGETLREKIAERPLKLEDAIDITSQIAQGLAKAHEQKIIHRDIKPANIFITTEGQIKILDFGVAKLAGSTKLTLTGTTLGTVSYMAPEQAKGDEADHKADVWSLGVLMYEMLTGQQPFKGEHEQAIIYSILNEEPEPITALRTGIPIDLEWIVLKALKKDPKQRYQHIDELPVDLEALEGSTRPLNRLKSTDSIDHVRRSSIWYRSVPLGVASVIAVSLSILVGFLMSTRKTTPTLQPVGRFVHNLIPNEWFPTSSGPSLVISPDGTRIAYVAETDDVRRIYIRPVNEVEAVPVGGTEGAQQLFFSPDSRELAFFSGGELKKMPAEGGSPIFLCEATGPRGGTWGDDGSIIFGSSEIGLLRVSSVGGIPEVIAEEMTRQQVHYGQSASWPEYLPGSEAVLYNFWEGASFDEVTIALMDLGSQESKILIRGGLCPRYSTSGHILFGRSGAYWAVPFDVGRLRISGQEFPVHDGVYMSSDVVPGFSFSSEGALVYLPGEDIGRIFYNRSIGWVDHTGNYSSISTTLREYCNIRVSPTGELLALTDSKSGYSLWLHNVERGTQTPLTLEGTYNSSPRWTNDGKWLAFTSNRMGDYDIFRKRMDDIGDEETLLIREFDQYGMCWTPDDLQLVFWENHPTTKGDIWVLDIQSGTSSPILNTSFDERTPALSSDGRWLAYASNQSGVEQVYIKPFPGPGREELVSNDGGHSPLWAPSNNELYFVQGNSVMGISFQGTPELTLGTPISLFSGDYFLSPPIPDWDIHPDGNRFLIVRQEGELTTAPTISRIQIVQNWFEELKHLQGGR